MTLIGRILRYPVSSDSADTLFGQWAAYVAGLVTLVLALLAVSKVAESSGELVIGILVSLALALQLVLLGLLVPLTRKVPGD